MKRFKYVACSIALASLLATITIPQSIYADDEPTVVTETSEDGSTTTTTTTTTTTNEDGSTDTHIEEHTTVKVSLPSEMPLVIEVPAKIVHPSEGSYTINYTIKHTADLEGVKVAKGKMGIEAWDVGTNGSLTEIVIPEEQSDSWYTIVAKDVNGSWAIANVYAHCELEDTPTPTPTPTDTPTPTPTPTDTPTPTPTDTPTPTVDPITVTPVPPTTTPEPETQGCPDGYTLQADGQCYANNPGCPEGYELQSDGVCVPTSCPDGYTMDAAGNCVTCPDGYQMDSTGNCVRIPRTVAQNSCPEGKYMDENGNCVDKIVSLPQTGGFDSLMIFFMFGIGAVACGIGVIAYAKKKENSNNIIEDNDEEDIDDEDDNE